MSFLLFLVRARRGAPRQRFGLALTTLGNVGYYPAFSSRLPGSPIGFQKALGLGDERASAALLILLTIVFLLRSAVFISLFVVPAFRQQDEELGDPQMVFHRANDVTAPILAYFALADVVAALISLASHISSWEGVAIFVALAGTYYLPILLNLERIVAKAVHFVEVRLATLAEHINIAVLEFVRIVTRSEQMRARGKPADEEFYQGLQDRRISARRQRNERVARASERLSRAMQRSESERGA